MKQMNMNSMMMLLMLILMLPSMISSSSMFNMWVMMEIFSMLFTFILINTSNKVKHVPIMYMINALTSATIMASMIMNSEVILSIMLIMKMGMFPFHYWPPLLAQCISWEILIILTTLMKMPALNMMLLNKCNYILILSASMTSIVSFIKSLNLSKTKLIFIYSSMIHSSWMVFSLTYQSASWQIYFIAYSILMIPMCMMMKKMNIMTPSSPPMKLKELQMTLIMVLAMNMLSLPPSIMFLPKVMMINDLNKLMLIMSLICIMIPSATMSLVYLRMMSKIIMKLYESPKMKILYNPVKSYPTMLMLTLILIILVI